MVKIGDTAETLYGALVRIIDINNAKDMYFCEFLDSNLFYLPPMWYYAGELKNGKKSNSKCECGAKHDRSFPDFHSAWCPSFKESK